MSNRSPEMQHNLDRLAENLYGRTQAEAFEKKICIDCGRSVTNVFRDKLSLKEWKISGLCQDCQDLVFSMGPPYDIDEEENCVLA